MGQSACSVSSNGALGQSPFDCVVVPFNIVVVLGIVGYVWRMDRAFRSVLDAATTLERLRTWGVGLRSYSEPWLDTTSHFGEALYYITIAYAQLERGILRERVKAGMERARKQGHKIGRPRVTDRRGFNRAFRAILERLRHGEISRRRAAKELHIGYATLTRLLDAQKDEPGVS